MGNPSRKTPSGKQENGATGCLYPSVIFDRLLWVGSAAFINKVCFQSDSPSYNESYFVEGLVITLCLAPLDLWPLYLADIFLNGPS